MNLPDDSWSGLKEDRSRDALTAFVSNLDFKLSEDQLREIFSSVGEVTEIRLVRNFKGQSKGFAYVQFKDEVNGKLFNKMQKIIYN